MIRSAKLAVWAIVLFLLASGFINSTLEGSFPALMAFLVAFAGGWVFMIWSYSISGKGR